MRPLLSLLALLFALPAAAQDPAVQEWFRPQVAFTWPQPFNHNPQTFEAQAVRFTTPPGYSGLSEVDVFAHSSTSSPDGFNDTLVVSVHRPDANGYPGEVVAQKRFELAEVEPSKFTTLPLDLSVPEGDFWLSLDLKAAGQPDQLVLVSAGADDPALDRAAVRVANEGWRLMRESQFGKEFNFHVRARFSIVVSVCDCFFGDPTFGIGAIGPQPASDVVRVWMNGAREGGTLEVFDLLGRPMLSVVLSEYVTLDTSALSAGLYLLRATSGEETDVRTLVVR